MKSTMLKFSVAFATILSMLALGTGMAQAAVIRTVPGNYPTIQAAIDAADPGDTIYIANGLYKASNTTITKRLTLQGQTKAGVVIAPAAEDGGANVTYDATSQQGFIVVADDVTISDLTIDGDANNLAHGGTLANQHNFRTGILNIGSTLPGPYNNLMVKNVVIRNIVRRGINLYPATSGGHVIMDSLIENVTYMQGIYSAAAPVTIAGNTIRGVGAGIGLMPNSAVPGSVTLTVTDNTLYDIAGSYSLYYNGSETGWPSNAIYYRNPNVDQTVIITGNRLTIGSGAEMAGAPGVLGMYIYNADANSLIEDNIIDSTHGTNNWGIYLGGCAGTTVHHNTFTMNESDSGIYLGRGDLGTPTPNVISSNTFTSTGSTSSAIEEGVAILQSNDGGVFWMAEIPYNTDNTITGNTINGFVRGIALYEAASGDYVEAGTTVTAAINNNKITGNTLFGVDASTLAAPVDATCNWWGSINGPGPVGPGSGDRVSDHATYSPWRTSATGVCNPTVPSEPTGVWVTAGDGQATVNFSPPWNTGGSPISGYIVTSSPGDVTASGTGSPITVTGLVNGTAYTFTVKATNGSGTGPASTPSNSVTPTAPVTTAPPVSPAGVWATAGDASATVNFSPPWNTGGSPILSYTVISSPGGITVTGPGSPIVVTGLTNGTPYTFTVAATNSVGTGPASRPSNSVTPKAPIPGPPTGIWARGGDASATVNFSPPWNTGGTPITGYTVTSSPGGITVTGPGSPIVVTGLLNGTPYTFTVTATNGAGTGPASTSSNSVTPQEPATTLPGAPSGVWSKAGDATATVTFSPPWNTGGTPITSYTVTSSPGNITVAGPGSPIVVAGLTNETAYTFTVKATNSKGTGPASAPSNSVTPRGPVLTLPGAPTGVWAMAGDTTATVHFSAPWNTGGTTITGYEIRVYVGGVLNSVFAYNDPAGVTPVPKTFTGLTNGTAYTFKVMARNSVGAGPLSASSNSVTPKATINTAPGAPTGVWAAAGDARATVNFSAPWNTGGAPIEGYTVTSSPGGITATGTSSPIVVTGLNNNTAYTFTVTATNSIGTGPASAPSGSVTPKGMVLTAPGAPSGVWAMAGDTQATITFGAPWNTGGTPITGYTVTSNPGGVTATGTGSPIVVTGLTNNTAYTFTVTASNSVGPGPASGPSNSVTPKGVVTTAPGPPSGVWATAGNARATVNFSAPWNTGGTTIISYTVTSSPGGIAKTGYRSPIVVTGLTNGVAYTFTVKATNIVGTGAASMPSRAVTPTDGVVLTVPGPPTGVSATAGNTNATITFSAPADTGGTPITGYTVTGSPGGTATGVGSPITVTGLTNGTGYTFTVKATNIVGTGPASTASNSVTPAAPVLTVPGAPTGVSATAGNARATVTFSAPADTGGTPIIEYRIYGYKNGLLDLSYSYGDPGGVSPVPWTFEGLTNGASYTFTVTARNSVGDSPSSAPSSAVIPSP